MLPTEFGASEALVVLLALALVGAMLVVLPSWLRLMRGGPELPINRFLRKAPPFVAEVRCAFCSGREDCLRRNAPREDCPNLALFSPARRPIV